MLKKRKEITTLIPKEEGLEKDKEQMDNLGGVKKYI